MDTRQSERWKFKEIAKIQILEFFTKLNKRTLWSLLIRCVNSIACEKYTADTIMSIDRQTGKVKSVYTPSTKKDGKPNTT